MQSQSNEPHAQLAQWLHSIVEILRDQQNSTWRDLVHTVSGKTAVIELDGIQLRLRASGREQLQVEREYLVAAETVNFRTSAETLRDVIAGRLTLDTAIALSEFLKPYRWKLLTNKLDCSSTFNLKR